MAFTHEQLIGWSRCWQTKPEKLAARRALWPDVLTWRWFLDPVRVGGFPERDQIEILSTAVAHAARKNVRLDGMRAGLVWARAKQMPSAERLELGARLAVALDLADGEEPISNAAEFEPATELEPAAEFEPAAELEPVESPPPPHRGRKRR